MNQCRFCGTALTLTMVDLGMHPLCESFPTEEELEQMEPTYPLHVRVCEACYLAQIGEYVAPEVIFDEYAYYSSYSTAWLEHARAYVASVIGRFGLDTRSRVVEIASNDGYLLQYFQESGFDVLGIEPSWNVADAAEEKGIPTIRAFFGTDVGRQLKEEGRQADLLVANNVLAHTPDINGFVAGVVQALAPSGVATFEFPHLMRLIDGNQFDTIYHEHWSYLSLGTATRIFEAQGLVVFDVEELWTHGGSLRLYVKHASETGNPITPNVEALFQKEWEFGMFESATYESFSARVASTKRRLLSVLIDAKDRGESIVVYGAAGKGNTLLNYCGVGTDVIDYACDINPFKHGRFTPGTHIPIYGPAKIKETKPDMLLVLPWNIEEEIVGQLAYVADWGGRFLIPIPEARIVEAVSV
jgi:SAM-dependent methyltransferase